MGMEMRLPVVWPISEGVNPEETRQGPGESETEVTDSTQCAK